MISAPPSPLLAFAGLMLVVAGAVLFNGGNVLDVLLGTVLLTLVADLLTALVRRFMAIRSRSADRSSASALRFRHHLLIFLICGKAVWLAVIIPSAKELTHGGSRADLLARRDYLRHRVLEQPFGPGDSPSAFSPAMKEEWAIGTLSMFGAALANLSFEFPDTREEHLHMIEQLIRRMLEPDIRMFEQRWWNEDALTTLEGENGHIGYLGHLNFLFGIYRILGGGDEFSDLHEQVSAALARRILKSPSRYLETFPGQIFIPDNAVVVASLALLGTVHRLNHQEELYRPAVQAWLESTRTNLIDPQSGIIVPWVDDSGRPLGHPRGSYSTWDVFYLLQADPAFAVRQSELIRANLLARPLPGACGIREFLRGHEGTGDVDSGPVIFSLSTSGTGFGMATARALGDTSLLHCLLVTGELIGNTYENSSGRRYLIAPLIGDAIVLAMRTALPWDGRYVKFGVRPQLRLSLRPTAPSG